MKLHVRGVIDCGVRSIQLCKVSTAQLERHRSPFYLWEKSLLKGTICVAESSGLLLTEPGRGVHLILSRDLLFPGSDEEVTEKGVALAAGSGKSQGHDVPDLFTHLPASLTCS